jgi:hypothetical protein
MEGWWEVDVAALRSNYGSIKANVEIVQRLRVI